jgi:hypothetical protein
MEAHVIDASFRVHHQWKPARDALTVVFLASVSDTAAYSILVIANKIWIRIIFCQPFSGVYTKGLIGWLYMAWTGPWDARSN